MKTYQTLLMLILISLTFSAAADDVTEIEIMARIQEHGNAIDIIRESDGNIIPSLLQNDDLKKTMTSMKPGDHAMVKGHISYQSTTVENKIHYKPIFLITSIKPFSLRSLGEVDMRTPESFKSYTQNEPYPIKHMTIPVTTELASAITMTTTALLMSSLTANPNQGAVVQDLNSGMILFAGVLATGVFIFEQIHGKKIR